VAKDRTIYVGKVTGVGLMEIYTFKPIANGATRCGSSMMGEYKGRMEDYLKTVVDDYDRATIILHDDFDKVLRERPTVCVHGMALEHRCFECEQLGTK
jgi:hypothetical protein